MIKELEIIREPGEFELNEEIIRAAEKSSGGM